MVIINYLKDYIRKSQENADKAARKNDRIIYR